MQKRDNFNLLFTDNKEHMMCIASSKKYDSQSTRQFTSRLLIARSCCLISSCSIAGLRAISIVCIAIQFITIPESIIIMCLS